MTPNPEEAMDLMELAERVEGLEGPDREVDVLIAEAIGWQSDLVSRARTWSPKNDTTALVADVRNDGYLRGLPTYTASLDAAMSLVPEGWAISTGHSAEGDERSFATFLELSDWSGDEPESITASSDNWAASIAAAALRARARASLASPQAGEGV